MLENTVNGIEPLRAVKAQAEKFSIQNKKLLTFEQYCSFFSSVAQSYDLTFATKPNSKGVKRSVHEHDTQDSKLHSVDDTYDLDLPIQTLTANSTQIQLQDDMTVNFELQQFNSFLYTYYTQATTGAPRPSRH